MTRVGITGASGVVGKPLLRMLLDGGYEVNALMRSELPPGHGEPGLEAIRGDLTDPDSLHELVDGCTWVFNVAGVNEMCVRDPRIMDAVNIGGVENIVQACVAGGVSRLIHTSSAVTIGEERGTVATERSEHRGWFLSDYERSKYLGETALFQAPSSLEVVAVNPSSVQGPGRATGTGKLILDVVNGRLPIIFDSIVSLVDIDDCARAHLLAAAEGTPGQRYLVSGASLSVKDALALCEKFVEGFRLPRFVPGSVAAAAIRAAGSLGRAMGRDFPLCAEMVRVMRFGHTYDGTRAVSELGLEYRSIEATFSRMMEWFRSEGLLNPS